MTFSPSAWWAAFKRWGRKLLLIQDNPEKIAAGFAIGVFFGLFPTLGLGGLLAIGLAWLVRANTAAALVGTVAGIPLLSPLVITASGWIGTTLVGGDWYAIAEVLKARKWSEPEFLQGLKEGLTVLMVGNTVLSLFCAGLGYLLCHALVVDYQRRKSKKRQGGQVGH